MKLYQPNDKFREDNQILKFSNRFKITFNNTLYDISHNGRPFGERVSLVYDYIQDYGIETGLTTSEIIVRSFEDVDPLEFKLGNVEI